MLNSITSAPKRRMPDWGTTSELTMINRIPTCLINSMKWKDDVYLLPNPPGAADPNPTNQIRFTTKGNANVSGSIYLTDRDGFFNGSGRVYRILVSGSGEIELFVKNFRDALWADYK